MEMDLAVMGNEVQTYNYKLLGGAKVFTHSKIKKPFKKNASFMGIKEAFTNNQPQIV
jgi:chemotaxis receptor (MCP) glutamine deamidase CheD